MKKPDYIHGDIQNDTVLWNDLKQNYEYNLGQYTE